jgi:response regulator RpfG family c-di-GMP phosphodiesterase
MSRRILFVDDEPNVLSALQRALRGHFEVETCDDPVRALSMIQSQGPFAIVVSDMRMPKMNGVELLAGARMAAPDTVRIMLTGNADQQTAVDAVNKGEIFKFLNKPVERDALRSVLTQGLRQYQLISAEKELLERTLRGSIKVLSEILAIVKPEVFGRIDRLRAKAGEIAARLGDVPVWEIDTAANLALLGCVGLAPELMDRVISGAALSDSEQMEYLAHPLLTAELIRNIPRLHNVADIILYQHKHFDGRGFPIDERRGEDLPIGARILHVVLAHDELKSKGWSDASIHERLRGQTSRFDPRVIQALGVATGADEEVRVLRLPIAEVRDGMIFEENVTTTTGILLVCEGQEVTPAVRRHLLNFLEAGWLSNDVLVATPRQQTRDRSAA